VSQKNIQDIFDCNLKINYQILIIFFRKYSSDNLPPNDHLISYLTQRLFLHYLGKHNQQNITFLTNAM